MSSDPVLVGKDVEEDASCTSGHCSWTGEGSDDEDVKQGEGEQVEEEVQGKEEDEKETEDDCEGSSEEAWWRTASLNREDVKLKRNVVDAGSWSSFFVVLARRHEVVETSVLSSSFSWWEATGATTLCATTEWLFLMRKPGDRQLGSKIS